MLDFVYLLSEPGLTLESSPGLASQILDRVRHQTSNDISIGIVSAVADDQKFQADIAPVLDDIGAPFAGIPVSRTPGRFVTSALALRRFNRRHGARYVYVRDLSSSLVHQLAFPFGGPELLYDMRGDVAAEARFRGTSRFRRWVLERLTSRAIRHADRHTAVSSYAAGMLTEQFGASDVSVMPSCVDMKLFEQAYGERESLRRELGVSDSDVLLVYAGGSQQYQMLPQMFRLWEAIAGDSTVHFLALTHGSDPSGTAVNLPPDRSTHMAVDRDRIPGYLSAADIGFLLRGPHPLNTVASPIKFGEYLASGLSVVSSPGIGDISQTIEQRDLGILVDAERTESAAGSVLKLIDDVRTHREAHAERSRQAARDTYDWGAYVDEWKEMLPR